jgi:hypothetical protein
LIAVAGSIVSLAWNYRTQRRAAELAEWRAERDAERVERQAGRDAERDYAYEARKRLYTEFQPILFQLGEACESAYGRIANLTIASKKHALELHGENWLNDSDYYRLSTIYRLIAPTVYVRLCRRRLTAVDLTVDPRLRTQYAIAKLIYSSWNDGYELADTIPGYEYRPQWLSPGPDDSTPDSSIAQHLVIGELDLVAEALTVTDKDETRRCIEYGEFEEAYRDERSPIHQRVSIVESLITDFRPDRRPVLWRLLLCQACLHKILMASIAAVDVPSPGEAIDSRERTENFDWRWKGAAISFEEAVEQPFAAAHDHLARKLDPLLVPSLSG